MTRLISLPLVIILCLRPGQRQGASSPAPCLDVSVARTYLAELALRQIQEIPIISYFPLFLRLKVSRNLFS
jgi:hypothetical protein